MCQAELVLRCRFWSCMSHIHLQQPIPINEAEAIIDPFWDQHLAPLDRYTLNCGRIDALPAACNPRVAQYWCWAMIKWDRAVTDRPVVILSREMNVNLVGYDHLMMRLAAPEHVRVDVAVVVDGLDQIVLTSQGQGAPHEYEAPIRGVQLQRFTLTLTSSRDQGDEAWLQWIGVVNVDRRAEMLGRPNPYDSQWAGWLLPAETTPTFAPRFGFFFDAEDLPELRRKSVSPAYRPLMERMRARVREVVAFHKSPEDQIGPYLAAGDVWKIQSRTRDWDTFPYYLQAPLIAFVGLIDQDSELLRFAARIAMSTLFTQHWIPHFMQDFPGTSWDTRAFPEAHAAAGVALVLDWAGSLFTDKAEHLMRYTLTHKALGRIRGTFLQYDYMWDCNQHHMISLGRLLALLVQAGRLPEASAVSSVDPAHAGRSPQVVQGWPRVATDIDQFEQDVAEVIDRYVQPDGSSNEGVGYWAASFRTTLPVLVALARYRAKMTQKSRVGSWRSALAERIAPKLNLMWNYVAPLLATAGEPGTYLPISDTSSNLLPWDAIGMAAALLEAPGWRRLLAACLSGGKNSWLVYDWTFDGVFTMIFGPDEPAEPVVEVPVFRRLEVAGMITSNRPWRDGTVRLHLLGAMSNAGHGHPDKGSFILEACGDIFAGDRGVTPYVDPRCRTLAAELAHNMAVPENAFQINPAPCAALWQGDGDERSLAAAIDASSLWRAPIRVARRRIHSPQPDWIEITDEFELEEARPVSFYMNTPLPITVSGGVATIQGRRTGLSVTAPWAAAGIAGEYYSDFAYQPYNRLTFTSAPATRHVLTTVLRFA